MTTIKNTPITLLSVAKSKTNTPSKISFLKIIRVIFPKPEPTPKKLKLVNSK